MSNHTEAGRRGKWCGGDDLVSHRNISQFHPRRVWLCKIKCTHTQTHAQTCMEVHENTFIRTQKCQQKYANMHYLFINLNPNLNLAIVFSVNSMSLPAVSLSMPLPASGQKPVVCPDFHKNKLGTLGTAPSPCLCRIRSVRFCFWT